MLNILTILKNIESILGSNTLLFLVFSFSFFIKGFLLVALIRRGIITKKINTLLYLLMIGIISALISDASWILRLVRLHWLPSIPYRYYLVFIRIAWSFFFIQILTISLFIEYLVTKQTRLNIRQIIFASICCLFLIILISISIINYNCFSHADRSWFEFATIQIGTVFSLLVALLSSILITVQKIRNSNVPRLLTKQLKLLLFTILLPYWIFEILTIYPFNFATDWVTNSYTFQSLSNIILMYGVIYCSRKMIGLRFLNFHEQVATPVNLNFVDHFKTILEQFSHATNLHQLNHITQNFFNEAFSIPLNRTTLFIRNNQLTEKKEIFTISSQERSSSLVETFMNTHSDEVCSLIKNQKVLIYDEISFSQFYEPSDEREVIINFLDVINADIFLPIYEKEKLIGYIIVDRFARFNEFYSKVEHDEMIVFASYLGNMINLLQNKDLDNVIQQEKILKEELYRKHQEVNQYKESIRSFLRSSKEKAIGIIFYKNRRFTFGNQAAKELIGVNPNVQEGHPLAKSLKRLAQQVEAYKSSQTSFAKDIHGNTLVIVGVPSLEQNNIILSVYHPEIADVVKKQVDMLKDPSQWDYLLYLETTKPGKLINQLIPGAGETLLNFKIELLKTALSKKATLLDMPNEDLIPMVELLHHISLRESLHIIDLQNHSANAEIAISLFGISSIFNVTQQKKPILEQLDSLGTLFIKNVHYLDKETQEYLAEFIRYGFFRIFKTDQKIPSNVRVICSTNQNLNKLVQEGKFSQALFNELKQTTLTMPSLITLPEEELSLLADAYSEQAVPNQTFKSLLSLTDKDKTRLARTRPASLKEMRVKIQQILIQKSKKNQIYQETKFDPAYELTDPELIEAARLGKHALKDRKIFIMLWNKFKNQNKIANLLGVNRSSVNRRCKMYDLE